MRIRSSARALLGVALVAVLGCTGGGTGAQSKPAAGTTPSTGGSSTATLTIRSASAWPIDNLATVAFAELFKKPLEEKSNGSLKINHLGGPEVMAPGDLLEGTKKGTVDMIVSATGYYAGDLPIGSATGSLDPDKARGAGTDPRVLKLLDQGSADYGVKFIGVAYRGEVFHVFANKALQTPEDFKGTTIRSTGPNARLIRALGAAPSDIAPQELLTALQNKVVDGAMRGPAQVIQFQETRYYTHVMKPGLFDAASVLVWMNQGAWDRLSADQQKLIMDVAGEMNAKSHEFVASRSAADLKKLETEHSYQVVQMDARSVEALSKARKEIVEQDVIPKVDAKYHEELRYVLNTYH
jgi:TRAP-type C4-dicarboxylate transport system substrate-binding protein